MVVQNTEGVDGIMKIYKAYKFRMYPEKDQKGKINSFLGTSRFIYNHFLEKKNMLYSEKKEGYKLKDMKKDLVLLQQEYPWLKEIDSCILRTTLDDLERGYDNFFRKRNSYPKFKSKNCRESYRTICNRSNYKGNDYASIKIDLEKRVIKLPKLDEIRIRGYRKLMNFPYKILNATITKEAGRYYVSVCVEQEIDKISIIPNSIIGIDLGVKTLVTCSDGIKYRRLKKIENQEKKIKGLQKGLARCQKGSKNSQKIKQKIQRAYQKIKNMRKYYIHEITTKLVKENDIIVTETLKVKKMIEDKTHNLSKQLSNASFSEIIRQLTYKTKWHNKKLYQIDAFYASSQICSHCGVKNSKVKDLNVRVWECSCGNKNDRDINASINIMDKGFEMYLKEQYSN